MREQIKLVVSDLHLGTGVRPGRPNTHEEFFSDDRFEEFLEYYSTGDYKRADVELIIAGDFLDLLKIPYRGRFPEVVDEEISADKVRRAIKGHPRLFDALARFVRKEHKRVTYVIGNHDQEIVFPLNQRLLRARLGLKEDSESLRFVTREFYYRLPGGIVVTHGHQFEVMNYFDPSKALVERNGKVVVNYPFGSRFVISSIAPAKREEPLMGVVMPLSLYMIYNMLFRFTFSAKVLWDMTSFTLKYWFLPRKQSEGGIVQALQVLYEQMAFFSSLDRQAVKLLRSSDDIRVLIMGHSHAYKVRRYPGNKLYINTGTWTKYVNLSIEDLGTRTYLTYAEIRYPKDAPPVARLMRWRGKMKLFEEVPS